MSQQVYGLPPPESPDPETPSTATIAMIGGLVFAALVFVIVGIGFVVGWWGPNASTDEVAEAEPAPAAEPVETGAPEPVVFESAEQMVAPDQRKGPEALDDIDPFEGAEPVPEIAPRSGGRSGAGASGGSGGGGSGTDVGARPSRVRVAFKLGDYEQVELKLGGKVLKLTSDRNLELPPGGYRVELRKSPDAPWKAAGLITLELGNRYRVTLLDPPLAKLEALK